MNDKDNTPQLEDSPREEVECKTLQAALDEYLEWLQEREGLEDKAGNTQARDAVADCSTRLCLILIESGTYTPS